MRQINTLIVWTDESMKEKIALDISLLCKSEISYMKYDEDVTSHNDEIDILLVDFNSGKEKKALEHIVEIVKWVKEKDPKTVCMVSGKYSAKAKKNLKELVDVFSGITAVKIKKDYRACIDMIVCRKHKLNYYLTDFFAPHLVGDLERRGFELILNETYDRESYKADFLDLWRSFMFIAPLLKPENRDMLKNALHAYEERDLYQEEKDAIRSEFFFMFNSLYSLGNFSERRLYYLEKSIISTVWDSVVEYARSIDNSLLFGCSKSMNYVRLKLMIHKSYPLKKITKNSDIYKTLSMLVPYGDVVISSMGEKMIIGSEPLIDNAEESIETGQDEESLTFYIYIRVILPHRRHRGLKRY